MKPPPRQLQQWIHLLEEGAGQVWLRRGIMILLTVVLAGYYHMERPHNFVAVEAMDMAQLGRNIAEGRGYSTFDISPLSMGLQQRALKTAHKNQYDFLWKNHPDITYPPVYPMMIAGLDKILPRSVRWGAEANPMSRPPPEIAIGLINLFWFGVTGWLVYWLGRRLFSPGAAFLATTIYLCTDLFWQFVFSGLPTLWLCSLTLLVAGALTGVNDYIHHPKLGRMGPAVVGLAIGALIGLGCLTVYSYGWLIAPALFALYHAVQRHRGVLLSAAVAGFVLVTAPWITRNALKSGLPFGTATVAAYSDTKGFPGDRLERSIDPDLRDVQIYEVLTKFAGNLGDIVTRDVPSMAGSWFAAFFFASLFFPAGEEKASRAKWLAVLTVLTFLIIQPIIRTRCSELSPVITTENLLVMIAPLLFVIGAGFVEAVWKKIEPPFVGADTVSKVFVVILCSAPLAQTILKRGYSPVSAPIYLPKIVRQFAGYIPKNALMMSDIPWAVAWYGGRECVDLTLRVKEDYKEDFFVINDQKSIHAVYLSPLTANRRWQSEMIGSVDGVWGRFYLDFFLRKRVPDRFPLRFAFDDDPVNLNYPRSGHLLIADGQYW